MHSMLDLLVISLFNLFRQLILPENGLYMAEKYFGDVFLSGHFILLQRLRVWYALRLDH